MPIFTQNLRLPGLAGACHRPFPASRIAIRVTKRLLKAALDFQESVLEANALRGAQRAGSPDSEPDAA